MQDFFFVSNIWQEVWLKHPYPSFINLRPAAPAPRANISTCCKSPKVQRWPLLGQCGDMKLANASPRPPTVWKWSQNQTYISQKRELLFILVTLFVAAVCAVVTGRRSHDMEFPPTHLLTEISLDVYFESNVLVFKCWWKMVFYHETQYKDF